MQDKPQLWARIDAELNTKLKIRIAELGITKPEAVTLAVEHWLECTKDTVLEGEVPASTFPKGITRHHAEADIKSTQGGLQYYQEVSLWGIRLERILKSGHGLATAAVIQTVLACEELAFGRSSGNRDEKKGPSGPNLNSEVAAFGAFAGRTERRAREAAEGSVLPEHRAQGDPGRTEKTGGGE
jgi:hypothetical protein